MDVKTAIHARRSIRKYQAKPIPKKILDELLDAARRSPSSMNRQRWNIIVITDEEVRGKLVPASGNQKFVRDCSAYLVGVSEPGAYYSAVDITIALDHLSLRAVELGLGTCWIGDFDSDKIKHILGIPKERDVPICMTVGYPAVRPASRKRKEISTLFHNDRWGRRLV